MAYKFNPFTSKLEEYGPILTGTGTVSAAADGTAALPGIAFTNDLNTGIYRPGADQLALSTNGNGRLFISSTGLVGIGTSSPQGSLHVVGNSATAGVGNINISNAAFPTSGWAFRIPDSGSTIDLSLDGAVGGTFRSVMYFARSTGAVGIGTTSPQHLLDCTSIGRFTGNTNSAASGAGIEIGYDAGNTIGFIQSYNRGSSTYLSTAVDGSDVRLRISGTERARIDSSGRLLVGTTSSPSSGNGQYARFVVQSNTVGAAGYISLQRNQSATLPLTNTSELGHINFGDNAGNSFASIQAFADADTANNDYPGRLVFSTTSDGQASPTPRLTITSTGQVRLAGAGITFNGDTATANELDDYEEGTFTPIYSGTWTTTPTNASARYTKIGRFVHIAFSFTGGAKSSATSGWVTGLPFTPQSATAAGGGTGRLSDTGISDRGLIVVYDSRIFLTSTTFDANTNYCDAVYTVA